MQGKARASKSEWRQDILLDFKLPPLIHFSAPVERFSFSNEAAFARDGLVRRGDRTAAPAMLEHNPALIAARVSVTVTR